MSLLSSLDFTAIIDAGPCAVGSTESADICQPGSGVKEGVGIPQASRIRGNRDRAGSGGKRSRHLACIVDAVGCALPPCHVIYIDSFVVAVQERLWWRLKWTGRLYILLPHNLALIVQAIAGARTAESDSVRYARCIEKRRGKVFIDLRIGGNRAGDLPLIVNSRGLDG